jgi:MFS family permease
VTTARPEGLAAYAAVTASYWAFMLTDGALRMLVLLHFHTLGFSPVQLAYLFVLYEIAGIATNLSAGWIAARFGLTSTLYAGLGLQVIALLALTQLDPEWAIGASVVFVMLVQGASGVAKRFGQDVFQICRQTPRAGRSFRIVPLGCPADWIEEYGQRVRFFAGCGAACNDWIYRCRIGHGNRLGSDFNRSAHLNARGPTQRQHRGQNSPKSFPCRPM